MPRVSRRIAAKWGLRARGSGPALLLALMCALQPAAGQDSDKLVQFDVPDQGAMPLGKEEKRYLVFGEAMYEYYSGRKFAALTDLLVSRKRGYFGQGDTDYAELLMGELYVTLGLPEQAEALFDQLLAKDLLRRTRAETWFHKGVLHYQEGDNDKAIEVLESDNLDGLPQHLRSTRALMLANLYMYQEDFSGALQYLYDIPTDTKEGAYANYNMGVAMVRSGQADQGTELLRTVMNLAPGDTETNALKDRAALAIGLTELRREKFATARQALLNVRADGPFSNDALLALGMVNFDRGAPKKALPLWLELVRRDTGHKAVQEALMLAPRAYEELGAMPQALAGYQFAANTYRQELKQVEMAIRDIDRAEWLESLKPPTPPEREVPDPMAEMESYTAGSGPEMAYLYKLFASHSFSRMFRQYMELDRLRQLLNLWERELPAMGETLATQKSVISGSLDAVRSNLVEIRKQQAELEMRAQELAANIPTKLDMTRPEDLASLPELIMWNRVNALQDELDGRNGRQAERLRRIRGLLLWDIASDASEQRSKQENQANNLVEQAAVAGVRVQALEQLVRDSTLRLRGDMASRFTEQYQHLSSLQEKIDLLIDDVKQALKNDALEVLAKSRQELADRLGEAHLAIARVQDESVSQPDGGAGNVPEEAESP